MTIMNFQSDVHSAVEVVKGWEIVQKTSKVSEEFNGRTFRYEVSRRTHPWSVQNNTWKREFSQKSDFSTFFRWMSSSKYESLHVRTHPFDVNWYFYLWVLLMSYSSQYKSSSNIYIFMILPTHLMFNSVQDLCMLLKKGALKHIAC